MRKTKIICTLGPATDDENVLRRLMMNGMNVARVNMSHGTHADQKVRIDAVKKLREELDLPVAILLDTKGPEIRTGNFSEGPVTLEAGQTFILTTEDVDGDSNRCSVTFKSLPQEISPETRILIDDGLIELRVQKCTATEVFCTVINGGTVSSHKGINIPNVKLSLPFISEQDKADIAFGVEQDIDFIAASFTRNANDIMLLRKELKRHNCDNIRICAKIENHEGIDNIDEIIKVSDSIMVARGDLGVEIPLEEIPILQKKIIQKVYEAGKQAITATQMLDSMMKNPRPTRAETTDVANAIYDGTSAIMLSGETAAGLYPVEAVKTMAKIALATEGDIDYVDKFRKRDIAERPDVTSAISHATCTTAHDLGAAAILTVSKTGTTARMISKYRPECPIICGTTERKVQRQMNLSWGVIPIIVEEKDNTDVLFEHVVKVAESKGLVKSGDLTVITTGVPLGISGTTNLLKVHLVGNVLVTGESVIEESICGRLCVCKNEDDALRNYTDGDILVIPKTTNALHRIVRTAKGIITEEEGINSHAAIMCLALNKPAIVGAKHATSILKTGTVVTLDGLRGTVYSNNTEIV
ncbi:MAG: pyruvate kinase [Clostridia bacterium]|nr:pyruvate kinase [Clostridia bacterium]MBQ2348437.1 pyruvate kinase [Clostridia bacterium]